jgi:hypothetical protein
MLRNGTEFEPGRLGVEEGPFVQTITRRYRLTRPTCASTMEPVTPCCPVGREPRKPSGAGLSVTQSGAIMTPNGRLVMTLGTACFNYLSLYDRGRAEEPLDSPSSWAGEV